MPRKLTYDNIILIENIENFIKYYFSINVTENTWDEFFQNRESGEFAPWCPVFGAEIFLYDNGKITIEGMYITSRFKYNTFIVYELLDYDIQDKPSFDKFKIVKDDTKDYYNKILKEGNLNYINSLLGAECLTTILDFKKKYSQGDMLKEKVIDMLYELKTNKIYVDDKLFPPINFKNDFYTLVPFVVPKGKQNFRYLIMYKYDEKNDDLQFSVRYQSEAAKNARYLFRDVSFDKFYTAMNKNLKYGTKGKELFTALNAALINSI